MDYKVLGGRIRILRQEQGVTQMELAEWVGSAMPYISDLERGVKKPSLAMTVKLAEAFGVSVDQLLSGNQAADKTAFYPDVQELLEDCSLAERQILLESASAIKKSLRKHKGVIKD